MLTEQFQIETDAKKLKEYLLNLQHPDGWSKAKFFRQQGFNTEEELKDLLLHLISNNSSKQSVQTGFGVKYVVDGQVSPESFTMLRTVWIVLEGEKICRFVTAYPL